MAEQLQAVVRGGVVEQVLVCTPEAAAQLRDAGAFAGADLHDVTDRGVSIGWRLEGGDFAPPAPDPDSAPAPTGEAPAEPAAEPVTLAGLQEQVAAQQAVIDELVAIVLFGGEAGEAL